MGLSGSRERPATIVKPRGADAVTPNLDDYERVRAAFTWTAARAPQEQHVTVWYTAPTAIRMLMKAGTELAQKYDTRALRFLASVGEPLNPEAVVWGREAFGRPFHDNWWQTEWITTWRRECRASSPGD